VAPFRRMGMKRGRNVVSTNQAPVRNCEVEHRLLRDEKDRTAQNRVKPQASKTINPKKKRWKATSNPISPLRSAHVQDGSEASCRSGRWVATGIRLNDSRCVWLAGNKIGVWSRDGRVADVTQTSVCRERNHQETTSAVESLLRTGAWRTCRRLFDNGDKKQEHQAGYMGSVQLGRWTRGGGPRSPAAEVPSAGGRSRLAIGRRQSAWSTGTVLARLLTARTRRK
jgi:hypothetical protein